MRFFAVMNVCSGCGQDVLGRHECHCLLPFSYPSGKLVAGIPLISAHRLSLGRNVVGAAVFLRGRGVS